MIEYQRPDVALRLIVFFVIFSSLWKIHVQRIHVVVIKFVMTTSTPTAADVNQVLLERIVRQIVWMVSGCLNRRRANRALPPSSFRCMRPTRPLQADGHHLGTCHQGCCHQPTGPLVHLSEDSHNKGTHN